MAKGESDKAVSMLLLVLVLVVAWVFLMSWVVKVLYNYVVPNLMESVGSGASFKPIDLWVALSLLVLCGVLFGGHQMSANCCKNGDKDDDDKH